MHYKRLLLDDFGVFQRAELRDLEPGLTVIAGPQRAGKTTLMEALRRLGYGITQGEDIPPPADTYRLGAELTHAGDDYRLDVEGYGDPYLAPLARGDSDVPQRATDDIFGALSKQQYRQLYTLSLNQLQRLPPTIEEPEDLSRVLLGAAYGSIADLPEVRAKFDELADDIGGELGRPMFVQFRDAYQRIEEGQDQLEAANAQVEEHDEAQAELRELEEHLAELQTERDGLAMEQRRVNVVQQFFEEFDRYRRLGEQVDEIDPARQEAFPDDGLERAERLAEAFDDAREAADEAREEFVEETSVDDPGAQRNALLEVTDELDDYRSEVSGWRERLRSIRGEREELRERRSDIEARIDRLRADWTGTFSEAREIETDLVSRDAVEQAVTAVTEAEEETEELETELEAKRERKQQVEDQLAGAEGDGGSRQGLLIAAGGGVVGVLAAIGLAVATNPIVGVVVGAVIVLIAAGIALRRGGDGDGGSQRTQLRAQKNTLDQEITELEEQYERSQSTLEEARERLESVRERLGVGDDLSPDGVRQFHGAVVDIQADIAAFAEDERQHQAEHEELTTELRAVAGTVARVQSFEWDDDSPLEHAETLFDAVERAAAEAELAADWATARDNRAEVQADIAAFLKEWDTDEIDAETMADADPDIVAAAIEDAIAEGERLTEAAQQRDERLGIESDIRARFRVDAVRDAFEADYDPPADADVEEWYLDAFEAVADQYASLEEVERRLNAIDTRVEEIDEEREQLQQQQAELNQELDRLASEDDLIGARRTIQQGAQEIDRLAEEYATYRIAEDITERLQDRFIEETTGPLLDEAGRIFARITNEYDGLEHTGELENLDFRALRDDESGQGRSELSRATAEQLFMSVRLARIRQIETPLPVVLDDALTNFDPAHSARTIQLIDELATTNQVFFLTAHPAFVELTAEHADVTQFWRLDDGRFEGPFDESGEATAELNAEVPSLTGT